MEAGNAKELAEVAVTNLTGDDPTAFTIQEVSVPGSASREFIFRYRNRERLPPGSDVVVSVELDSGEVTIISD